MGKIAHCSPHYIDINDNELYHIYIKELMFEYNLTDRVYWDFNKPWHLLINDSNAKPGRNPQGLKSIPVVSFDSWMRDKKLEIILGY